MTRLSSFLLVFAASAGLARAEGPAVVLQHQGRLFDGSDVAADGTKALKFQLTKTETVSTGDVVWEETYDVTLLRGTYAVPLGGIPNKKPLTVSDVTGDRWLSVVIDGVELLPRLRLGTVANAVHAVSAEDAKTLGGVEAALYALKTDVAPDALRLGGKLADLYALASDVYAKDAIDERFAGVYTKGEADTKFANAFTAGAGVKISSGTISADFGAGATQVAPGTHDHDAAYVRQGAEKSITAPMLADGAVTARALGGSSLVSALGLPNILAVKDKDGAETSFARPGDAITVTGQGFGTSPQLRVGGKPAASTSASDTTIAFTVGQDAESGFIEVINPTTNLRSNPVAFQVRSGLLVGNGKNGVGNLTGIQSFNYTTLAASAALGATQVQVANAGALSGAPGDLLLVIDLQGTAAGTYDFVEIASFAGNTVNLKAGLNSAFNASDKVVVQRVPQYSDANLSGTVTANGWDGTAGGVFAIAVSGTLNFQSGASINMDGKGYRGNGMTSGESWNGPGCAESSINGGGCSGGTATGCRAANQGGGGGIWDTPDCPEPSSGGGGYGTAGANGKASYGNQCYGAGGGTYGDANLTKIYFGSAGGRNNNDANSYAAGAAGGSGGGIVIILAKKITNLGPVVSRGTNGAPNHHQSSGAGAGGSVLIKADMAQTPLDLSKIDVSGGVGGSDSACVPSRGSPTGLSKGGDGGSGRSRVVYF